MISDINDLTLEQLDMLVLAMDFFVCNGTLPEEHQHHAEELLLLMDQFCEYLEAQYPDPTRLLEKRDNLLVVDFTPKNG